MSTLFSMGKPEQAVNRYFVHKLSLVSYKGKYVYKVLVNRLFKLAPR